MSRSQQDIVDSQVRFAFDFFRQTSTWAGNENNMVISPLSLSIDLAMFANGAGERTYDDIVSTLHLPDASTDELNTLYKSLVGELLGADRKVEFSIANGIWNDQRSNIKTAFAENVADYYAADIQTLDFSDSNGSKEAINRWAAEKTKGIISNIFDGEQDLSFSSVILCNALYFNGEWSVPFVKEKTKRLGFTNIDNSESTVEIMAGARSYFSHALTDDAEIISLPYGNRTFSMYVILPSVEEEDGNYEMIYERFIENLDYDWWTATKAKMNTYENINVKLPKFKVETLCPMIGLTTLHELRTVVTDPDFSKMTDSRINFLRLDQYNSIEVMEKGTVAVSVTKGDIMATLPMGIDMNINRPFIFLIEERSTGAILFMGKVMKL
ncbi:MAG: hypothetical protein K2I02_07625 [Duncaniella sp.]|nr:hypothetical protein [Duncaniella sp.]